MEENFDCFGMLSPDLVDSCNEKQACAAICDKMGLKGYQIGKSKVFLRAGQMAELDARRLEALVNAARFLQRQIRTHLIRKQFLILKNATIKIQNLWRGWLARKLYEHMKREDASICIQKYWKVHAAKMAYTNIRLSAIVIQTGMHAMAARNNYRHRRRTKAAIIIQTQWRLSKARKAYLEVKKGSLILQCLWRGRIGRMELRKLRMAARETGALKEAKDKLEKKVEELTWRLDFEKHLRIDLEEAKGHEIARMQSSLQEMQEKLDEANVAIIKEKEAARIAISNAPPVIKEVPVVDNAKLELLTIRNKELEDELVDFKTKAEEFEKRYCETQKQIEALIKESENSQAKISQLQEMIESLETNMSSLESENQVLRQQALVASENDELTLEIKILESKIAELESENKLLRSRPVLVAQQTLSVNAVHPEVVQAFENGQQEPGQEPKIEKMQIVVSPAPALSKQKSLTDRQQENLDALIKCLMEDKRFDKKRSVAAYIVYKSLIQWHSFEAEKTNIFDRIIHTIKPNVENQENIGELAYWLSTTSTLLFLLQNTLKLSSTSKLGPNRRQASTVSLFGRMERNTRSSSPELEISSGYSGMASKSDTQSRVDAKYPALLFKQQLTAYVEKIYGMIRDRLKKEISPFLTMCIQASKSTRIRPTRISSKSMHSNVVAKQASSIHWQSIVKSLDHFQTILCDNYVHSMIIRKIYSQAFAFINVQLFNSLLLRRECCSSSNGEFLKAGLHELEEWCSKATKEFVGTSWDELQHIKQAVGFLVLHQKAHKSLEEITIELCPALSLPQIYRIGTMFWDDKYGTQGLSQDVIGKMRAVMSDDSTNIPNNSFLLDDDSSIPFSLDDISRSGIDVNLVDVEAPPLLRQNSQFHFLSQQLSN